MIYRFLAIFLFAFLSGVSFLGRPHVQLLKEAQAQSYDEAFEDDNTTSPNNGNDNIENNNSLSTQNSSNAQESSKIEESDQDLNSTKPLISNDSFQDLDDFITEGVKKDKNSKQALPENTSPQDSQVTEDTNKGSPDTNSLPSKETQSEQYFYTSQDKPNLDYENQLYSIYREYYKSSISNDEWLRIIGPRATESYQVQSGDNLWNLSRVFFGDGRYWPKVWSVNRKIENPHLIEPGLYIHFLLGSDDEVPAFTISETGPNKSEGENNSSDENQMEDSSLIPPPQKKSKPVAMTFPPSLPRASTLSEEIKTSINVQKEPTKTQRSQYKVPVGYFVSDIKNGGLKSFGKVIQVESGANAAVEYQYVYVKAARLLNKGEKFLTVSRLGGLKTDNGELPGVSTYVVQSYLEIEDKVQPLASQEDRNFIFYKAFVLGGLGNVTVGSSLVKQNILYAESNKLGRRNDTPGNIVGGQYSDKRLLFTKDSIVYLNLGSKKGVEVGDIFPVYKNQSSFIGNQVKVLRDTTAVGILKIVNTSHKYSTAIVIQADQDLELNDFVGGKLKLKSDLLTRKSDDEDYFENGKSDRLSNDIDPDLEGEIQKELDIENELE